eukprot:524437-Rhodomonas_salina.5
MPLRLGYAMSGTDIACSGTGLYFLQMALPVRSPRSAYARAMQCPVLTSRMVLLVHSHSDLGVGVRSTVASYPTMLRARYAMSGTDVGSAGTRCMVLTFATVLHQLSGTDIGYAGTRWWFEIRVASASRDKVYAQSGAGIGILTLAYLLPQSAVHHRVRY